MKTEEEPDGGDSVPDILADQKGSDVFLRRLREADRLLHLYAAETLRCVTRPWELLKESEIEV
jgi:hypothetical protein